MAHLIKELGLTKAWWRLLKTLLEEGRVSSPRGQKTVEILNMTVEVRWGLENIIISPERDLNYRFMIAEWLWITAGLNGVDTLARYNSVMKQFSDDGLILSGAYGPRLMPQIPYILDNLKKRDTRQAVATIWTPNPENSKDIPCTVSVQWLIRPCDFVPMDKLHCIVNMRSSDAWLGFPYDYFTFSQVTNWISLLVGVPVGSVTFNLGSSHLYERNWEAAGRVIEDRDLSTVRSPDLFYQGCPPISWEDMSNILNHPERMCNEGPMPWVKYAEALTGTKASALEVLRELSTQ